MTESPQAVRVFISSPGDVTEERERARRVVEELQRFYLNATLLPVLWEELALPATASFQETIDYLLEREPIDIAVFVLWSRLGTPLGPAITRPNGTPYRSGTEREFDLMLTAFEQSGRERPVILAYVRKDDASFKQGLAAADTSDLGELINQQKFAEAFIVENFHDSEGRNLRAYQTYREPVGFVDRLRIHLRQAVDDLLDIDTVATWKEEPFRGLDTFDVEHAPIFYGREKETCDLLEMMRDRQDEGCAFVVVVGGSGSGKSSLARAGVSANLLQQVRTEGEATWRMTSFIPSLADQTLFRTLVRSLAEVLPDLVSSNTDEENLAQALESDASAAVKRTIAPAFAEAGQPVRLLLILDQMEELWTNRLATADERERFLSAIEALAECGHVTVLATLRSDFYHHAQQSPTFIRLKGTVGQFDLLPPDTGSLHRLITQPAKLSGLKFEQNEQTGRSLDEVILEDSSHNPNALPLLEYTLSELYRQRDDERHIFTYAAYVELGGVEGAIGKRAEEVFTALPSKAQATIDEILPLLVSVDVGGVNAAVRRRSTLAELTSTPSRQKLVEALIASRFLTSDRQGDTALASLSHEALIRSWDRIVAWINVNRELLLLRARVEQQQERWEQQDQDETLLLAAGLPLDEGRQLLEQASHLLTDPIKEYIHASIANQDRKAKHSRRRRTAVVSTVAALLAVMIVGGLYLRSSQLVKRLLQANTSEVPDILSELASYPMLAQDELVTGFAESSEDSPAKLHAALALLGKDDAALPFLKERLLDVSAIQFSPVRDTLDGQKNGVIEYYWGIANDRGEDDNLRFQAACALASYDTNNDAWRDREFAEFVAGHLVGVLPSELLPWRNALEPVSDHLVEPLSAIYRDDKRDTQLRGFATDTLTDYLSEDADGLFNLLADSSEKQFGPMFDQLRDHRNRAVELGNAEIAKTLPVAPSDAEKEVLAMRQANAAVMLLRMDAADQVWPLLKHSPDPRVRSYIIHWLAPRGGDAASIITRYQEETDITIKRALLLCLGEFELEQDEKEPLTEGLLEVYRSDPDAGQHAAAEWLLRQWGQSEQLAAIDQALQQKEEQLVTEKGRPRQWYVNTQGQTFVIFDAGEFLMGSPETEPDRENAEDLHQRQIGRRIAMATKEVTRQQWRFFSDENKVVPADHELLKRLVRTDDSPMTSMNWYEAAGYCNWLSEQEGIPEHQWCYVKNEEDQYGPGMKVKEKFWELSGYRLPTEAEWEYACRAGASSSRYYGVTEALLPRYAWYQANGDSHTHPVASLKPNDYGLFDMHGNLFEWCYDAYGNYPVDSTGSRKAVIDSPSIEIGSPTIETVEQTERRVLRGGAYNALPRNVRAALRDGYQSFLRDGDVGLRPARTYNLSP